MLPTKYHSRPMPRFRGDRGVRRSVPSRRWSRCRSCRSARAPRRWCGRGSRCLVCLLYTSPSPRD
eukprot:7320414-Heterocapsa_arctica.AAC.1